MSNERTLGATDADGNPEFIEDDSRDLGEVSCCAFEPGRATHKSLTDCDDLWPHSDTEIWKRNEKEIVNAFVDEVYRRVGNQEGSHHSCMEDVLKLYSPNAESEEPSE